MNSTIQQLELQGNAIYTEGISRLAAALPKNRTLQHLDLGHNQLGIHGAELLSPGLPGSSLTSLNLSGNRICGAGAQHILLSTKDAGAMAYLDLAMNEIGSQGIELMCPALAENGTVTSLNLGGNRIDAEGAERLCSAISENAALRILILGKNEIGEQGAASVADMLKRNGRLTCLDLTGNSIGDVGTKHIATAIETHRSFKSLALAHNAISDQGAGFLASAAHVVPLCSLALAGNAIGDDGGTQLLQAAGQNPELVAIDLLYNNLSPEMADSIEKLMSDRPWAPWATQTVTKTTARCAVAVKMHTFSCFATDATLGTRMQHVQHEETESRCENERGIRNPSPQVPALDAEASVAPASQIFHEASRAIMYHKKLLRVIDLVVDCVHAQAYLAILPDRLCFRALCFETVLRLERKLLEPQEESVSEEAGARSQANQNETLPRIEGDAYSLADEPERGDVSGVVQSCLEGSLSLKQAVKDEAIDPEEIKAIMARLGRCASGGSSLMKHLFIDQDAPFTFHGQMPGEDKDKKFALRPWAEADAACTPAAERAAGASSPDDTAHLLTEAGHCLETIGRAMVMTPVRQGGLSSAVWMTAPVLAALRPQAEARLRNASFL
ncbi:Nlrc3 [Symbiodinium natans]|uniref:Nlrc3 protein n=1 Tax=Symbiodinium natans TaxID=878477 RepID=A0A812JAS6_9DINO|nr:Nlrc3 [Symbiodinium natans]